MRIVLCINLFFISFTIVSHIFLIQFTLSNVPFQDEVVEDLDRDHNQELKRIILSLELKRIRSVLPLSL